MFCVDGRTDMTTQIVAFRNPENEPKNGKDMTRICKHLYLDKLNVAS